MKTNEETVIMNESGQATSLDEEKTILENEEASVAVEAEGENAGETDDAEKKNSTAKNMGMGAAAGIVLGVAGTLFSGATIENPIINPVDPTPDPDDPTPPTPVVHEDIELATSVNDDMSFNEAFAAARHEVGAGGAFVWHGTVYGTYYGNEWNSMSAEEQSQFTHDAIISYHESDDYQAPLNNHASAGAAAGESAQADVHTGVHQTEVAQDDPIVTVQQDAELTDDQFTSYAETQTETIEVHVLGHEEGVVLNDGSEVNVGYAEIGGEPAMFVDMVDADGNESPDGVYDVVVMDANGNEVIEDNEVAILDADSGMTVENFDMAMEANQETLVDDMYASMPDYSNDADVSSLC